MPNTRPGMNALRQISIPEHEIHNLLLGSITTTTTNLATPIQYDGDNEDRYFVFCGKSVHTIAVYISGLGVRTPEVEVHYIQCTK
jgi:hypothetical protein